MTKKHSLLIAIAAVALLVAGCASKGTLPAGTSASGAASSPRAQSANATKAPHISESYPFEWGGGVGAPMADQQDAQVASSPDGGTFDVVSGIHAFNVTVTWTCASPTCTLRLGLFEPGSGPPGPGSNPKYNVEGTSPLKFSMENPATGTWRVRIYSSGPTAGVSGTATVEGF